MTAVRQPITTNPVYLYLEVGGVINVLPRPSPLKPEADVSVEGGDHGWRDGIEYDRQSATCAGIV